MTKTAHQDECKGATALMQHLRQRAEEVLRAEQWERPGVATANAQQLIYELQVHQAELELQNEELQHAHQELLASRDRYNDLYEFAPVGLLTVDAQGTLLEVNLTACTLFGVGRVSLVRTPFARWLSATDSDVLHQHLQHVFETDTSHTCALHLPQRDGSTRTIQLESMALRGRHGDNVRCCRTALLDITARKHAEEALHKQAEIIDQVHDAVMTTDLDGIITSCNQGAERMLGYTCHELCGQSMMRLFPEEDRTAYAPRVMVPLLAHGRYEFETRQRRKSGELIYCHISLSLLRKPDGTPEGIVGFAIDVTARRKAEEWLEGLIAATQDAVISIDRHARLVRFNPAAEKIFGYSKHEVEGKQVNLLMPEPYASEHDGYIARYEETGVPRAIGQIRTVTGRRKSGELFPIELSVTEIAVDEEVHYAAVIRDVSEKVRLHDKAVENERLATIGVTAAKLAHEIGNPLNSMTLSLQLLERRLANTASDEKAAERVRGLRNEVARLTHLLQEFRNLSRRQNYRLAPTDLNHLVTEVLTAETENYTARGVRIVHDSAPELSFVKADADKLKQVLLNLCKNAVEAMPDGGTLTVRVQQDGNNQVHLHITDTGSGIPDDVNIFEPFITTKPEGTGLGLAVVRQIIAAHGGELTYQSALARGTTFTVTLVAVNE